MAVSPIDGRYRSQMRALEHYFSEFALIRYRVRVELEWYLSLAENDGYRCGSRRSTSRPSGDCVRCTRIFRLPTRRRVKALEATTNHDVKAVEYFLKERFKESGRGLRA